jgi:hypothetical protein
MYHTSILVEELLRSNSRVPRNMYGGVITKMDKKWSYRACEYKSGRRSNIERHLDRKHGDYGVPVLTQSQHMGLNHSASPWYHRGRYFPQTLTNSKIKNLASIRNFVTQSNYLLVKIGI